MKTENMTRRGILAGTAAACLAGLAATPALASTDPDADLKSAYADMIAAWHRKEAALSAPDITIDKKEAITAEFDLWEDRMLSTPHHTPAGAALKLAWVWCLLEGDADLQEHVINGTPLPANGWPPHQSETRMIALIDDIKRMAA